MAEQKEWTERDKRINRILYGIAIGWLVACLIALYTYFAPARNLYKDAKEYYNEHELEYIQEYERQRQKEIVDSVLRTMPPELLTPEQPSSYSNTGTGLEKYK